MRWHPQHREAGAEGPLLGQPWTVVLPERLSAHGLVPGNALSLLLALGTKDARYGGNGCIVPEAGPCLASNSLSPEQMLTLSVNSNVSLQVEDAHSKGFQAAVSSGTDTQAWFGD